MSEETLDELLDRIDSDKAEWDEPVAPPASADDLARLVAASREELQVELPPEYLALLSRADGVDYNGSMIYGSRDVPYEGDAGYLYGFLEANRLFRDTPLDRHHILFGESGDDYYALDTRDNQYGIFDKVSLTPFDRFETCGELLAFVLREAIA